MSDDGFTVDSARTWWRRCTRCGAVSGGKATNCSAYLGSAGQILTGSYHAVEAMNVNGAQD